MTAPHAPIRYSTVTCRRCQRQTIARTREAETLRGWIYIDDTLSCGLCPACARVVAPEVAEVLRVETPKRARRRLVRVEARKAQVEAAIAWWLIAYDAPPTYLQLVDITGFSREQIRQSICGLVRDGHLARTPQGLRTANYRLVIKVEPWRVAEFINEHVIKPWAKA